MSQHMLPDLPDFTGWTLEEVRVACRDLPRAIEVRVVETAPPLRPARQHTTRPAKKPKPDEQKRAPRPLPNWGQWRVLRCVPTASTKTESGATTESTIQIIELLVAREELAPRLAPQSLEASQTSLN